MEAKVRARLLSETPRGGMEERMAAQGLETNWFIIRLSFVAMGKLLCVSRL